MKEKTFKDLGLDDDSGKMKKLETEYNLDELLGINLGNVTENSGLEKKNKKD